MEQLLLKYILLMNKKLQLLNQYRKGLQFKTNQCVKTYYNKLQTYLEKTIKKIIVCGQNQLS